ncbi:unnamed protein product [Closterium sp. NIES-53]
MPLKPQRPPCFDPSQQGGPTVQAWLFTLNVFFDANYVSEDTAKIRYTVSLLRGPAMDWWRVIVTKPMDYATLPTWEGQTGPWAPSYFVEVPQYCTWDAWCAEATAIGDIDLVGRTRAPRYAPSPRMPLSRRSPDPTDPHRVIVPVHAIDHTRPNKEGTTVDSPILLSGKIGAALVNIFADGGASHSLINTATSRRQRLPLERCLPEIEARLEILVTTLDRTDILLSLDWLRRHNPRIDWTTGDCTVRVNGNNIALPRWGSPESSSVRVNAITMKRAVVAGADVYAVDIWEVEAADKGGDLQKLLADVPDDLAVLLKQYSGIFLDDLPTGLPPQRPHDHWIELEPGAQPTVQRQF